MEKCYFKELSKTQSPEGLAYLKQFGLEVKICMFYCGGYRGYGECDKYITKKQVDEGGLKKLLR